MFVGILKQIDMKKLKEINVYLSARCRVLEEKGGYGYVIKSEGYNSFKKKSCSQTTFNRMEMKAAIDAMQEIQSNVGTGVIINFHTKQRSLITSMLYGHCKKFAKRPNQDLVRISIKLKECFIVYVFATVDHQCDEIDIANNLSKEALNNPMFELDKRDEDLPKSIDLLFGI